MDALFVKTWDLSQVRILASPDIRTWGEKTFKEATASDKILEPVQSLPAPTLPAVVVHD